MEIEISHLRKKFCILSSLISLFVIAAMLLILNLLMTMLSQKELKTASDMVVQTANTGLKDIDTENISLKNTEITDSGDYVILRDPQLIESITLNGSISCTDASAEWYCAGGGIYFDMTDEHGNSRYIHKDYKFNQGNTSININFSDNSDFKCNGQFIQADISQASRNKFLISKVWWANSSTSNDDENVYLKIESIDIHYKENVSPLASRNFKTVYRSFTDIYDSNVPQMLNNFSSFYCIEDKEGNIIEINSGNLTEIIPSEKIESFIGSKNNFEMNGFKYSHITEKSEAYTIHIFIYSLQAKKNSRQLLIISVMSGGFIFIILLMLIYLISGRAIKPIHEGYKKQKQFISNAGHELKTPITVITATTELIEKKNGPDRHISCIQAQSKKMSVLVNELLSLSNLSDYEKITNTFRPFSMSKTIRNTVLYFESLAFEEHKNIVSDIQENIDYTGIPEKIDELTGILLENAMKYSDKNSQIHISLHSEKNVITLRCQNSCSGFSQESLPYIFDRFYRCDKSHSGQKEGYGLGLSIAKEIVSVHNGNIRAEYKEGQFVIFIDFS